MHVCVCVIDRNGKKIYILLLNFDGHRAAVEQTLPTLRGRTDALHYFYISSRYIINLVRQSTKLHGRRRCDRRTWPGM